MSFPTPTVVTVSGRTGVTLYENTGVVSDNQPSTYVIFRDSTFGQYPRASLTAVPGAPTGNAALGYLVGLGPGN